MTDDDFRKFYAEKHDESIYITLTNLAKIRIALHALRDTQLLEDDPFIPETERQKIITKLTIWHDKIANAITDDDDYLLDEDGDPLDYDDID